MKTAAGTAAAAARGVGVKVAAVVLAAAVAGGGTYAGLKHHADRVAREEAQLQAELETAQPPEAVTAPQTPERPPEAVTVPKPQDSPAAPADEPVPTPAAEQETAAASGEPAEEPAEEPAPDIPAGAEEMMLDAVVAMMYMDPGGNTRSSIQMRTSDAEWFWNAAAVFFVDYGDVMQPESRVPREEVLQFAYALCPDFREEDGLPPIPEDSYLSREAGGQYVLGRGDMGEVMHTAVGSRRLPDGSAELDVDVSWPNGDGSAMITEHYTAHLVPNAHVLAASYKPLYYTVTSITPDGAEEETLAGQAYAYLDGLWETWGGKPYSTYYLFSQGTITVYTADIADDGETWTYAESGTTQIERAENMSDGVSEGTAFWLPGGRSFYFSRPGEGDILECRWIEDDGSWGYSGTDSLARITDLTVEELLTTTFGR